jgi:tripartite-type tricarboxylate transporter receptor subunit TctC
MSSRLASVLKRKLLTAAACGLALTSATSFAQSNTIKLMVGFPAGGGTDVIARVLGEQLSQVLGTPVIVENRAGAGGQIAAQAHYQPGQRYCHVLQK